jgi:hypothetical protein
MKTLVLGSAGFLGRRLLAAVAGARPTGGPAQTLGWSYRTGAAAADGAPSHPLCGRTFDLAYAAEVAALASAR